MKRRDFLKAAAGFAAMSAFPVPVEGDYLTDATKWFLPPTPGVQWVPADGYVFFNGRVFFSDGNKTLCWTEAYNPERW